MFPIARKGSAITQMLDLPISCHSYLMNCAQRAASLRNVMLTASRTEPKNNAPIELRAVRLADGEPVAQVYGDVDGELDRMFRKNVEYALQFSEAAKSADIGLRVLRDRKVS